MATILIVMFVARFAGIKRFSSIFLMIAIVLAGIITKRKDIYRKYEAEQFH